MGGSASIQTRLAQALSLSGNPNRILIHHKAKPKTRVDRNCLENSFLQCLILVEALLGRRMETFWRRTNKEGAMSQHENDEQT